MHAWSLSLMQSPRLLQEAQAKLFPNLYNVYQNTVKSSSYQDWPLFIDPSKMDRRFDHPAWKNVPYYRSCHQAYLTMCEWLLSMAKASPMPQQTQKELVFYLKQTLDAYAPSNFPATNPEIFMRILEEGDQALTEGIARLFRDWQDLGPQEFFLSLTRPKGFNLGENLALTPGQVVLKNKLMELIQYEPVEKRVYQTPLLIVPPWINKYYVFDLSAHKSFVDWARKQGHTVFIISWVNPDASMKNTSFLDYLKEGLLPALDAACDITGAREVHGIGYCLGGNLLSIGAAHLKKQKKNLLASLSLLATIGDFSRMEDLGLFLGPDHVNTIKKSIEEEGYMDGYALALIFSFLRANNLIWSALVNKYFLGKDPFPLDFLHWNADPSSLPARMYLDFLEHVVQSDRFLTPEGITLEGQTFSFHDMDIPCFVMAAQRDHIAPWKSCFPFFQAAKGKKTFILATAGHIAGVINSPVKNKYSYFHLERYKDGITEEDWAQKAIEVKGSWWPFWHTWIVDIQGKQTDAPPLGNQKYPATQNAPGTYVLSGKNQQKTAKAT
ncbi:PHA/PHB synthase family protein [Candidatus Hepatobacter penaei]|uniref:PHA/PHB synthase family protein n=1 Tax=Candidatus Hepatobacter penaei TaxID=1274402 RepID=UPI0006963E95|nr:hypothetical protein [Candidatus Hepatobacter penaei]